MILSRKDVSQFIDLIFALNLPEKLIELIDIEHEEIRVNTIWALSNITVLSSDFTNLLIKSKIYIKVISIMRTASNSVKSECLSFIANLIAESVYARDNLLETDLIDQISVLLENTILPTAILKTIVWLISNLVRESLPPFEKVCCYFKL